MRKLLIFLVAIALLLGSAAALPMLGPAQGFRNPGAVDLGSLTIDGVAINGGTISYDDLRNEMYVNETAINASIATRRDAAYVNESAIVGSISALTVSAEVNETAINASISDLVDAAFLNETAINASISALTDAAYLNETAINDTAADVALGQTYQNTTLANIALGQTYQNTTLANMALGQTYQNSTLTLNSLAHAAINSTKTANKNSDYINTTAINTSIGALVVPLVTFDYTASSVDQGVFAASGGWVLTAAKMTPRVVGSDGGAVTVMVKICDSGEAPTSGDNMLSGTLDLKGTADTPQSGTVSAGTIATGKIVALDFTGTLTGAVGTITLYGTRA